MVTFPIAHKDGSYFADEETLDRLEGEGLVAFRYCEEEGESREAPTPTARRATSPASITRARTVLGLMPHPERLADPALGGTDGAKLFEALVEALP